MEKPKQYLFKKALMKGIFPAQPVPSFVFPEVEKYDKWKAKQVKVKR